MTISFLAIGGCLSTIGLILTVLGFTLAHSRPVAYLGETVPLDRTSAQGKPFIGVVMPLHYEMTRLVVRFRETGGRVIRADIRDLLQADGQGHRVLNYDMKTASEGTLSTSLTPGSYDVHFVSTDQDTREVAYQIAATEFTHPLRSYTEVALTTLTVGIVFLVEGLTRL